MRLVRIVAPYVAHGSASRSCVLSTHIAKLPRLVGDGQQAQLHGRQPEGKLARRGLDEDGKKALERAKDSAVDHDGLAAAALPRSVRASCEQDLIMGRACSGDTQPRWRRIRG